MPNYLSYLIVNLYLSSLFYNSVIINMFKKWITIPVCFRNWRISYCILVLNLRMTFWCYCNTPLQTKTRSFKCNPIDKTLKMLFIKGSGNFLRPTIPDYGSYWFLEKINKYMKVSEIFSSKYKKLRQSPESIKEYTSKYNGCRSVIKYI